MTSTKLLNGRGHLRASNNPCKVKPQRSVLRTIIAALALCAQTTVPVMAQTDRVESTNNDGRVYWPRLDFVIPFNVDVTGQTPREIQLEFSENGGKSWSLYSTGDVRTKQFHFRASMDGEYQFRLKTLDSQGRVFDNPGEPLQVVVDTTKPDAKLIVDIDQRGDMHAEFEIVDVALDSTTIQLAYQTEKISQWQDIPIEMSAGQNPQEWFGNGSWSIPGGTRQLVVRLIGKDKAGNSIEITRLPQLPRSASMNGSLQLASGKHPDQRNLVGPSNSVPIGSGVQKISPESLPKVEILGRSQTPTKIDSALANQNAALQQLIEQQSKLIVHQQLANKHELASKQAIEEARTRPRTGSEGDLRSDEIGSQQFNVSRFEDIERLPPLQSRPIATQGIRPSKLPVRTLTDEELERSKATNPMSLAAKRTEQSLLVKEEEVPTASPRSSVEIETQVTRVPGESTFRRDIKPLYSDSKAFSLDYNIENDPDSPVSTVELWGTADEGQTWQIWGQDPDRASPFDIQVETDGLFGFRMVIAGANGLASNRPRNGDNADAWIHVDTQSPQAKIVSALYGKGKEAGSMIIEYRASDDYFPERPITLSYAETPNGPWSTIASGVRNNSRYVWPADPSLPQSIYLKIEAHDAAGNVGTDQLDLPIDVEGLAPRGRIQGFRPIK